MFVSTVLVCLGGNYITVKKLHLEIILYIKIESEVFPRSLKERILNALLRMSVKDSEKDTGILKTGIPPVFPCILHPLSIY